MATRVEGLEHSSARMERFLQLCAQYNIQIINCSTPANVFHMIEEANEKKI